MADLIDRERAEEIVTNHRSDFSMEKDFKTALACVGAVPSASCQQVISKLDCVSRQQAIEALICADDNIGKNTCIGIIKKLPSAQKYTGDEIQKMQDLEQAEFDKVYQLGYEDGKKAAQPEIVRCRDCQYGAQDSDGWWYCTDCGYQIGDEDGSGFCANAERRTDG